jgi:hypothetical protein
MYFLLLNTNLCSTAEDFEDEEETYEVPSLKELTKQCIANHIERFAHLLTDAKLSPGLREEMSQYLQEEEDDDTTCVIYPNKD